MYRKINLFLQRFLKKSTIFKTLFNISTLYRRTSGRIMEATEDMSRVKVRIKFSWKNVNYNGSMFGGSMSAATDPIFMIQYNELLGGEYVVWDKTAKIQFKRPAKQDVWADFVVDVAELDEIKQLVAENGSYTFFKSVNLTGKDKRMIFATVEKEIYIASREHYKQRKAEKEAQKVADLN